MLSILVSIAIAPQAGMVELAKELGVPYDATNGFFEYVAAARDFGAPRRPMGSIGSVVMTDASIRPYYVALTNPEWAAREEPGSAFYEYAKILANRTPIEIRRLAMSDFKSVSATLGAGRNKKVWEPRRAGKVSERYVVGELRRMANYLSDFVCEAEMADGNRRNATLALVDCFQAGAICEASTTLVGSMFGYVVQENAARSISKHLSRLALPDIEILDRQIARHLETRPFEVGIRQDIKDSETSIAKAFEDPKKEDFEDHKIDISDLIAMSPTQRAAIRDRTIALLRRRIAESKIPESFTPAALAAYLEAHPVDQEENEGVNELPIPERLLDVFMPAISFHLEFALLRDIKLRLMRASLAVARYRWHHDRLPAKLTDAGSAEIMTDPITGKPYRMRINEGDFELVASATKAMPDVTLTFGRPIGGRTNIDPPPPGALR